MGFQALGIRWSRVGFPALACGLPLTVYLRTLAPDLGAIDSGELAAVAAHLQIAHPTGYPLYTLIGRIAILVFPGSNPIQQLNLLSALLVTASSLGAYLLFRRVVDSVRKEDAGLLGRLLALSAAWLWAIHPALWRQAIGNEVHALQAAIVSLLLWVAWNPRGIAQRLLVAYLLGIGVANHMTVLYLVPGLLFGGLMAGDLRFLGRRRDLLLGAIAFLLPLSLYLYLPLRSLADPLLDWGDPTSPERFLRHVGAAQYRIWMFASAEGFTENLLAFLREFRSPQGALLLASGLLGFVSLLRYEKSGCVRLALGLAVGAFWASGYEIHDLEPYFLIPRLCLAALAVAGFAVLLPAHARASWRAGLVAVPLLTLVLLTSARWTEVSRSGDRFVRRYAESLLTSLPQKTVLLSRHWDLVVSPLLYLQQVEGQRPDVTVVDIELLRRSWYFPQLRRNDPMLFAGIEDRVDLFLEQLLLFERDLPYDPREIESRFHAVIAGVFESQRTSRPVYHTPEVEPTFYGDWIGIPERLAVRMVVDPNLAPRAEPLDVASWARQVDHVDEEVRRRAWAFGAELARARIRFLEDFGRREEAEPWRAALARLEAIDLGEGR